MTHNVVVEWAPFAVKPDVDDVALIAASEALQNDFLSRQRGFISVTGLSERLGVAYTSAQRAIDHLESAGIVGLATAARRNRIYCARRLLAILEEVPRLSAGDSPPQQGTEVQ